MREEGLPCKSKEEERKWNKERGIEKEVKELDFLVCCSQGDKINEKTFGAAKSDKRCGLLGWDTWDAKREKSHHPLFQLMAITLFTPYKLIFLKRPKKNITLHTYISLT